MFCILKYNLTRKQSCTTGVPGGVGGPHSALWQEKPQAGTSQQRSTSFPLWQPGVGGAGGHSYRPAGAAGGQGGEKAALPAREGLSGLSGQDQAQRWGPRGTGSLAGVQALWVDL